MLGATTIPFLGASGSSVHFAGTQRGGWSQVPSLHTTLELSAGWKGASHVTVTTGHTMCSDHEARHVIMCSDHEARHVIISCSPWSWPTLAPTSSLSTLPLLTSGTIHEAGKSSITDSQEIYDTDHSIGAQGGSRGRQPDKWCGSSDQRMSFPPRTWDKAKVVRFLITCSGHLNVTTECRVVLLPSSQPLDNIPGEPQFISARFSLLPPGFYRNIALTFTDRGPARPLAVSAAHPAGRPHNHEAVVTLGARHRLEPHRGEAQPPVLQALRHRAAHSWEKEEYIYTSALTSKRKTHVGRQGD